MGKNNNDNNNHNKKSDRNNNKNKQQEGQNHFSHFWSESQEVQAVREELAQHQIQMEQEQNIIKGKSFLKFNELREKLIKVLSKIEAKIDFPDEDLPSNVLDGFHTANSAALGNIMAAQAFTGKATMPNMLEFAYASPATPAAPAEAPGVGVGSGGGGAGAPGRGGPGPGGRGVAPRVTGGGGALSGARPGGSGVPPLYFFRRTFLLRNS